MNLLDLWVTGVLLRRGWLKAGRAAKVVDSWSAGQLTIARVEERLWSEGSLYNEIFSRAYSAREEGF